MPEATLILSAYNRPHYVLRSLQSLERQTVGDFDVVIADDGSEDASRAIVDDYLVQSPLSVRREWQPDEGFRKTRILNQALAGARGNYLIFADSDCVFFPDFIAQHLALRAPQTFLSAGAVKLSRAPTERILNGDLPLANVCSWEALRRAGQPNRVKFSRMFLPMTVRAALDAVLPIKKTFNGLNGSCWRKDALAVGGFDEGMGYGSEDVEFGIRLRERGVRAKRVRHRIRALHLDHDRPYVQAEEVARNRDEVRRRERQLSA